MIIRNDHWDIVVRTSMNLNENPRLENIEISENKAFAEFFQLIVDDVFSEVGSEVMLSDMPKLENTKDTEQFNLVSGNHINANELNEVKYTHVLND
jgi:hypothetical protein